MGEDQRAALPLEPILGEAGLDQLGRQTGFAVEAAAPLRAAGEREAAGSVPLYGAAIGKPGEQRPRRADELVGAFSWQRSCRSSSAQALARAERLDETSDRALEMLDAARRARDRRAGPRPPRSHAPRWSDRGGTARRPRSCSTRTPHGRDTSPPAGRRRRAAMSASARGDRRYRHRTPPPRRGRSPGAPKPHTCLREAEALALKSLVSTGASLGEGRRGERGVCGLRNSRHANSFPRRGRRRAEGDGAPKSANLWLPHPLPDTAGASRRAKCGVCSAPGRAFRFSGRSTRTRRRRQPAPGRDS